MGPLVVDREKNLSEYRPQPEFRGVISILARIISYIFHPLFIPVYLSWLILKTNTTLFSSLHESAQRYFIPRFIFAYTFMPLVSVLLMKALGFVSSIQLKTQKDRIIPYVVCMIFYWFSWYVFDHQPEFPRFTQIISFAIFMASIGGLMTNIYMKISMHAIAGGVMAGFVMLLGFSGTNNFGIYISAAVFLLGLICTARFIDSDHTPKEIYFGIFIGIVSVLVAIKFA